MLDLVHYWDERRGDIDGFACAAWSSERPDGLNTGDWRLVTCHRCLDEQPAPDMVNAPAHYTVGGIETIDFIEAKGLGYHLGNVIKYVVRCDHKGKPIEDLEKAKWYIERAIELRKSI